MVYDTPFGTIDNRGPLVSKTIIPTGIPRLWRPISKLRITRSAPPPEKLGRINKIECLFLNFLINYSK